MESVFTFHFYFDKKTAKALVCLYKKGYNILFKNHVFNKELYSILPAGNLAFSFTRGPS